jgi:hypothetical protein
MTLFHFRIEGGLQRDGEPFEVELENVREAQMEAVCLLAELLKAYPERLVEAGDGWVVVADEQHLDLFRVDAHTTSAAAVRPVRLA